jgi:uncharacterized membrane protein (UPF0127 family)
MTTLLISNLYKKHEPIKVDLANTFGLKLLGLMFKKSLPDCSGLLISENSESVINSSIHMLFMNFDICAIWINKNYHVVDVQIAKKWHLAYFPKKKAQFVLEINSTRFDDFSIGDQLQFVYEK